MKTATLGMRVDKELDRLLGKASRQAGQSRSEMDFAKRNGEVARLWDDYQANRHDRVPVTLAFDEQFLLPRANCSFRRYYEDVQAQIDVQLLSQNWINHHVRQDGPMGVPEKWRILPPSWMAENEFLGADIVMQENDYAWSRPIELPKARLLDSLRKIDVKQRLRESTLYRQYLEMKKLTADMTHEGRPVEVAVHMCWSHGTFTKAAEIRGLEQMCVDLVDDPPFARDLLDTVTDLLTARMLTWHDLLGTGRKYPADGGWGMADDSIAMISSGHYEEFVLPCHRRMYAQMTTGTRSMHLCGRAQHLFKTLHENLGITVFNGPGPRVVDLPRMIDDIGAPIVIEAEIAHSTLLGTPEEIEQEVRTTLQDKVKHRAKMTLVGYVPAATPLTNLAHFYDCGLRYGQLNRYT